MEYIIQPLIGVNEFVFGGYRKDILAKTSLKIKSTREENDWGLEGNNKYPTLVSENLNDFIEKLTPTPLPTKEEIKRAIASGKVTITPKSVELKNAMRAKEGLPPLTFEEWDRLLNDHNRELNGAF